MIKNEFLCLKYKGVLKISEIMKSPSTSKYFGWKCRKYINWTDIQNENEDRKILKIFGDELIENNKLVLKYYGAISRMFFKVQQWKHDKNALSIEPPSKIDWDYLFTVIKNSKENSDIIYLYLKDFQISLNNFNIKEIQYLFYFVLLIDFFNKSIPEINIEVSLHSLKSINNKIFIENIEPFYKYFGLDLKLKDDIFDNIKSIYNDIGISDIFLHKKLNLLSIQHSIVQISFLYKDLDKTSFLNIKNVKNNILVEVNSRNKFIHDTKSNDILKNHFELFLKSYVLAINELPELHNNINTLNSYLALKLNQYKSHE